jgi:aminotransferase
MLHGFRQMGLPCFEPKGAFYVFPSIAPTGMSEEEFALQLLEEEKVAVVPGSAFGESGKGHIRCCYASSTAALTAALQRIERFVEGHRG